MIDLNNRKMKLPHDGYLKLLQLQRQNLYGYDVILIDEAQDLTPCMSTCCHLLNWLILQPPYVEISKSLIIHNYQCYFHCFPGIADILLKQETPKILVGDPHQQIYSFRGALNAMQNVEASHTFYLTQVYSSIS